MKTHTVRLKQDNMLCHRCLLNVAQGLGRLSSIQEFDIDLETKRIKVIYNDSSITRRDVQKTVNDAILRGVKIKS